MPRSREQERQAIDADQQRLEERRRKLAEAERDKSGIVRLPFERPGKLFERVGKLCIDEVERRLASS